MHRRNWVLRDGGLDVTDNIAGRFGQAVARYYLHPDVSIQFEQGSNEGILYLKGGQSVAWSVAGGKVNIVASSWHPGFGQSVPNRVIEFGFSGAEIKFSLHWKE